MVVISTDKKNTAYDMPFFKSVFKPTLSLVAVWSKAVVLLLLIRCGLLLKLWDSVIILCFVVRCVVPILVLQSSRWGKRAFALFVFLVS